MSLLPRCDRCGGLEVVNGPMGRSMESRCKCGDDEPNALRGDPILDSEPMLKAEQDGETVTVRVRDGSATMRFTVEAK
jgi:hypothetical protein